MPVYPASVLISGLSIKMLRTKILKKEPKYLFQHCCCVTNLWDYNYKKKEKNPLTLLENQAKLKNPEMYGLFVMLVC